MTKITAIFSCVVAIMLPLQASFLDNKIGCVKRPSPVAVNDRSLTTPSPTLEQLAIDGSKTIAAHRTFMQTPQAQAVLFAIRQGFDNSIIQPLVLRAQKNCPSWQLFGGEINKAIWNDSPGIKNLKRKMNDGSYSGTQRADFREQLADIQATNFAQRLR